MPFLHFLGFQLRWYIWRKRWLLPLPVLLFIAYRSYHAVRALEISDVISPNAWDLLFLALGNPYNIYLAFGLLYLYLVCDLLPEPDLGQLVLLRLGSRRSWWLGKLTTLLIASLIYVLGSAAVLAVIAGLAFPWQAGYSAAAMNMPEQVNLPMNYFRLIDPGPPILTLSQELLLLGLGLFCFGLVMLVLTQLTQRYFIGLAAGVVILFGSFVGLGLSGPPAWAVALPSAHLTYTTFIPIRISPVIWSVLYWSAWIGLLAMMGLRISRKQDHLAIPHHE
jgi:hypothetical protein